MSWFDAAQITTFATKAIKEAQKTLDKALDIQDGDEHEQDKQGSSWTNAWRRSSKSELEQQRPASRGEEAVSKAVPSVWGSISGSLFDVTAKKDTAELLPSAAGPATSPVSSQPRKSTANAVAVEQQARTAGTLTSSSSRSSVLEGETEAEFMLGMDINTTTIRDDTSLSPLVSSWDEGNKFSSSRLVASCIPEDTCIQEKVVDGEAGLQLLSSRQTASGAVGTKKLETSLLSPGDSQDLAMDDLQSDHQTPPAFLTGIHNTDSSLTPSEVSKRCSASAELSEKSPTQTDHELSSQHTKPTSCNSSESEASRKAKADRKSYVAGGHATHSTEDETLSDGSDEAANGYHLAASREAVRESSGASSADLISPSIEVISPSSIEVISSGGEDCWTSSSKKEQSLRQEALNSSVSSDRTLVEDGLPVPSMSDNQDVNVATMLYDAMGELDQKSPVGSSESSDIVKLECHSDPISCDELEPPSSSSPSFTSSSEVEVLSSPALHSKLCGAHRRPGSSCSDGSSVVVAAAGGGPGHSRNVSDQSLPEEGELIMRTQADHQRVVEAHREDMMELRKKNSDLSELLQARETRLLAMAREIAQVQEESGQMAIRLETALKQTDKERGKAENLLGELERATAELEAEKRRGNEQEREIERMRRLLRENSGTDQEKNEIITDLRAEGESLAKQNGKQAEIIRKLRAKEKTTEAEIKKFRTETDRLTGEVERLKKEAAGREEAGQGLATTLRSLTEANQAWEADSRKMRADLEDSEEKVRGLRSSLETAYREMAEMKRNLDEARDEAALAALVKETEARKEVERKLEMSRISWEAERAELEGRLAQLQAALNLSERSANEREAVSRRELELMRGRVEESEERNQDLAETISQASRPLLRQVESLQAALRECQDAGERVELTLTERLRQATAAMAGAQERERSVAEQYSAASARLAALEIQAGKAADLRNDLEERVTSLLKSLEAAEALRTREAAAHEAALQPLRDQLAELRRERDFLSASLESEKQEGESRRKKSLALMEQLKERDRRVRELQSEMESRMTARKSSHSSPTPSLSHVSTAGSDTGTFSRDLWLDDVFHFSGSGISTGAAPSLYDTVRHANTAAVLESLQAQLKIREGEISQLQSEIAQSERLREGLASELTKLSEKAEQGELLRLQMEEVRQQLLDLQQKYQTMLTMYGEKVEEAEELRLDLVDVKEMYKTQIDELLARKRE